MTSGQKLYYDYRLADGFLDNRGSQAVADEIAKHGDNYYVSRDVGTRALVRKARVQHDCGAGGGWIRGEFGERIEHEAHTIEPGDIYIETLINGSRDSGSRMCIDWAVTLGDAWINPPMKKWNRDKREWEPV